MLAAKSASPLICGLSKPVSRSSRSCSITAAMWAMPPVVERMKPSDPVEVEGIHNVSVTLLQILSGGESKARLSFRHDLRLETGMAIARHREVDFAKVAFELLFARAIAAVTAAIARRIVFLVAQVGGPLGFHRPLDQSLGQLLEQPVFAHDIFRLLVVGEQLVEDLFVNFHWFFSVSLSSQRKTVYTILFKPSPRHAPGH